jgi:hypothetical protein
MPDRNRSAALIFLLAMAVMILEVALTRVFSFITYHHMTYLVIAVAMLGFGAAGTFLTVSPVPSSESRLVRHAVFFGLATILALFAIPKIEFYPMNMYYIGDPRNFGVLFLLIAVTAVPFFFAGVCIAALVSDAGSAINTIYFADLAGSATGCIAAIGLVNSVGGVATCMVAAAISVAAAALAAPARTRWAYLVLGGTIAALSPLSENRNVLPLHVPPGKQMYGSEESIETVRWHVITRLDVGAPMDCRCSFGGALSQKYDGPTPLARMIFQDGSNLTGIIHPTPTPEETPVFDYYLQGIGYAVRPAANALVIGSGGGVDVMIGLHYHVRHVVAVDVNPKTMNLVRGTYAEFAGHVFDRPDVEPVVSEGRHFLSRDARKYDMIQLSGVDTWAAQASGAYALTENFVYTSEAFDEYLAHLTPDGMLGFSRPFVDPPLETFRLMSTALDALDRAGVEDPAAHLLVVAGLGQASDVPWAEMLVKRSAFTEAEMEHVADWSQARGFDVAYDPLSETGSVLDELGRSDGPTRAAILRDYPLSVGPVDDDAPFYFQYHRWRDLLKTPLGLGPPMAMWVLAGTFVEVLVLSALVILYPLYRKSSKARPRGRRGGVFFYFASLGLAFILVEVSLLQKLSVFLGGPAYAMSITLFTLLLSSGVGSLLSQGAGAAPLRLMARVTPLLSLTLLLTALFLDVALHHFVRFSMFGRAAVAIVLVAPLGLLMGVPFPTGMRYIEATRAELKPWAWGINACATVVGTTTCMLLVSAWGFRAALLASAAVYMIGWLVLVAAESGKDLRSRA